MLDALCPVIRLSLFLFNALETQIQPEILLIHEIQSEAQCNPENRNRLPPCPYNETLGARLQMHPDITKLELTPVVRILAAKEEEPRYQGVVAVVVLAVFDVVVVRGGRGNAWLLVKTTPSKAPRRCHLGCGR